MSQTLNTRWLICRICLKGENKKLYNIFEPISEEEIADLGTTLQDKIELCGAIKLKYQKNLPNRICNRCVLLLRAAYKFRDLCQQSQNQLQQFIVTLPQKEEPVDTLEINFDSDAEEQKAEVQEEVDNVLMTAEEADYVVEENVEEEEYNVSEESNINNNNNTDKNELYITSIEEDEAEEFHSLSDDEGSQYVLEEVDAKHFTNEEHEDVIASYKYEETINNANIIIEEMPKNPEKQINTKRFHDKKPAAKRKRKQSQDEAVNGVYSCKFCENTYTEKTKYTNHMKIHIKDKPHECEICKKRFTTTPQLSRHMNSHTGNRPYKCQFCEARFGDPSTKIKHERIHTNERPYKCNMCDKAFAYSNVLKVHLMTHTGEKPHTCDYCGKTFSQLHHKNAHEKRHRIVNMLLKNTNKMKSGLNEKWLVCRICLKQPKEEMQTIFDKNAEKDLTRMILECGGVPIKQFDHYPDKICSKCHKYLQVAYKFRLTCQRSHNHLSKFIAPVEVEKRTENEFEEENDSVGNTLSITEDGYVVEESNEGLMVKLEQENAGVVKEEYTVHIQEEDDDFVEIYEPMTEEEEKEVFQLADDTFDNDSLPDSQDNVEYLELEEDLELPSSDDDEEYVKKENTKQKSKVLAKRSAAQASTSRKAAPAAKRAKREPKEKKPKETSYICDFCGNKYPSQGRLTEHIKLHKGIKPHECEICGHCFAQGQQLARHMNTHTGNRPYKCSYCPAAFADLSTRNKHHRIHTNERPYVCDVCGKSFTYTNTLKFHKMIHTGEKPFVCDICGKGFPQNYKLRNHKLIHERKGIKLEVVEVPKSDVNQEHEAVYHDVHVEAAAQQLLEI
ncbi:hypothetical protein FF38_12994 [Lucilia cuprina]|uniref:Zinc finger protein 865 n=2 Tax=Lucilia cuprina TaxID=7375 RepID=A0A0L0C3K4_LUCCU|nr:hypothetical protein FF38_12994 [Lucilia cuprina]